MANSKSKIRMMAEDGVLYECYTKNGWFFKVKPAYKIDKVKFSFVKMGTNGQGFDIYVDMFTFDLLCDDILGYQLAKKVELDKQASLEAEKKNQKYYPSAWVHTTGENGQKTLRIGSGKFGVLVMASDNGTKQYGQVPCTYDDLRIIAKNFKRTSAKWFDFISKTIVEASEKYQHQSDIEDETTPQECA